MQIDQGGQATQINACRHPNDSGHGGKSGYRRSVALQQHLGLNCCSRCYISFSPAALIGSPSIDRKICVSMGYGRACCHWTTWLVLERIA